MNDSEILALLKQDLQKMSKSDDRYLKQLIEFSRKQIESEGISLDKSLESSMLIEQYAAYLFRKRGSDNAAMPRFLRFALNNKKLNQHGGGEDDNI